MWCSKCQTTHPYTRKDSHCVICGQNSRYTASEFLDKGPCQIVRETRAAQVEMAEEVENAIHNNQTLVAEAGTGTGKSFAVLLPAILSGKRVVISTATKLLQHQYMEHALRRYLEPQLAAYGIEFSYALYKGKSNYLCQAKFNSRFARIPKTEKVFGVKEVRVHQCIENWAQQTSSGDLADLDGELRKIGEVTPAYITKLDASECPGSRLCVLAKTCGLIHARAEVKDARIIITNHMMVGIDIKLGGKILPPHAVYIMDEAHKAEDYFRKALGDAISQRVVKKLLDIIPEEALRDDQAKGAMEDLRNLSDSLFDVVEGLAKHATKCFQAPLATSIGLRNDLNGMTKALERLQKPLVAMARSEDAAISDQAFLADLAIDTEDKLLYQEACTANPVTEVPAESSSPSVGEITGAAKINPDELRKAISRVESLIRATKNILSDAPGWALYVDSTVDARQKTWYKLINAPVQLGPILQSSLYPRLKSCIQTSATLTVAKDFSYYMEAMGVPNAKTFIASSPFDYKGRTLLYLPRHIPVHPNNQKGVPYRDKETALDFYFSKLTDEIERLLRASKGGAFVLFSARSEMNELYDRVRKRVPYPCEIQSPGASPAALENWFKNTTSAVLFATKSFWEGVSVEGAQLRMVIIPKVPFPSPTDPVITAKKRAMATNNDNRWFEKLYIPSMVMDVLQGFGRLMRTQNDFGIAALLDTRCIPNAPYAKSYARELVNSLPFTNATHDIDRVRMALTDMENNRGPFDKPIVDPV